MKRMFLLFLTYSMHIQAQKQPIEIPVIEVEPGKSTEFILHSKNPHALGVHEQNKWRYIEKLLCKKKDTNTCSCKITLKNDSKDFEEPAWISIVEKNKLKEEHIKGYLYIK